MIWKKAMDVEPGPKLGACAGPGAAHRDDLHVVELGSRVLLDVFINVEGRLTTFVSVDGQLIAELRVAGEA